MLTDGLIAGTIATEAETTIAAFERLPTGARTRRVTLRTRGDGPVDLLSWSAGRSGSGAIYANLGTIGATIRLTTGWSPEVIQLELDHLRPSLLVIAFGTNEGFRPNADPGYGQVFTAAVRHLKGDGAAGVDPDHGSA